MCGIAGLFHVSVPKPVDPARVKAMTDMLVHRGPDGSGIWTGPGIGFGHRRLSIIDLAGGAQPMLTPDQRAAITYNGEIYNFREVRLELQAKGHSFRTESDTEVILAAWREWGPDCLSRLHGMFAFALYDAAADALFLARDRLGVKPLYYAELPDGALVFASELKGLLAHPRLRRTVSPEAVDDYLAFGYVPDDACIVAGVRKLAAGQYLLLQRGRGVGPPVRWWDVDFSHPVSGKPNALAEELTEIMRTAVRSRMVADVPLGAFLSGGVDSSSVVALMAEASRSAVETCSIGFDEADHDETGYASLVADRFATRHRARTVAAADFGLIDTLADAFDEPFADASALATYRVSELAREKVTVALSGDGADEAFAGYRRYRLFAAEERARGLLPGDVGRALGRLGDLYPKLDWAPRFLRARTTLQALGKSSGEAYAEAVGVTPPALRSRLYGPALLKALQGHRAEERYVKTMAEAPAKDPLSRAQYADLKIWLPGDILTKVDRTSMAVGLEAREPLLDHRLVEFAARLPANMRLRGGSGKWLMKRAMRRYLPEDILHRRKMGFVTPISAWFRGPLASEAAAIARSSALSELGWFDAAAISRLAADHRAGKADHGRLLWQLLMLDKSLQRLFGLGASSGYMAAAK
ncbi:XrtA/PEP-CTERM system amidotransferase [Sphingosinicella humi]|uniref:asparagine synthase (glutamine-hydrolyzing) n=1 Tax=Allosphingosinicella humi TaxID=2068657 RepID=A0A2U2IYH2_9SPHN|nr:XrtA/PEP-CTERM system amidotransferase [Sphingosinicella humi]PWG01143.1 asparagine synthetase B [Sphingosinicella humi]